ncbi:hypothetical protein F511_13088 [Dorcoceras hygrometricum]|uniref:Uncharacterized protein n=1 Tax=Dorcoceras hygrometricum TaxID=472368 RepID=A0A2Z7C2P3_9LAMI|nr:hypothetical protein F511_13088 [Dorcoceras hygrometricum]
MRVSCESVICLGAESVGERDLFVGVICWGARAVVWCILSYMPKLNTCDRDREVEEEHKCSISSIFWPSCALVQVLATPVPATQFFPPVVMHTYKTKQQPDKLRFDDIMLCVGIEVADVSFADGSLALIVLCFGSWRQQRLRGFQQESAIGFRNGVVLRNQSMREEDATSFKLVASPRIDVAAGSSRGGSVLCCFGLASVCPAAGRCEGERRYRTLISLLGSLATMSRVVNYHSSWARKQQGELFDASGSLGVVSWRVAHYHTMNTPRGHYSLLMIPGAMFEFLSSLEGKPGFTAGRGFNPAGGAPGGG